MQSDRRAGSVSPGGFSNQILRSLTPPARRQARPMGRWVVYFSLAALPLFGLGQALIPAEDTGRRRYSFLLMTVYVASGLGLLLTTTLLGLRRYLRQRKLQMPAAMTGLWLGVGAAIIAAFLFVAALLPLSHPEYSLIPIKSIGSVGPGRVEVRHANRTTRAKAKAAAAARTKAQNAEERHRRQGSRRRQEVRADRQAGRTRRDKAGEKGSGNANRRTAATIGRAGRWRPKERSQPTIQSQPSPPPPSSVFTTLANVLKWIVLAILAIVVALVVLWFMARHLVRRLRLGTKTIRRPVGLLAVAVRRSGSC